MRDREEQLRKFVFSVILCAVEDALRYPAPRAYNTLVTECIDKNGEMYWRYHFKKISENEINSAEARLFLQIDNKMYRGYCNLLDMCPKKLYDKLWLVINEHDSICAHTKHNKCITKILNKS